MCVCVQTVGVRVYRISRDISTHCFSLTCGAQIAAVGFLGSPFAHTTRHRTRRERRETREVAPLAPESDAHIRVLIIRIHNHIPMTPPPMGRLRHNVPSWVRLNATRPPYAPSHLHDSVRLVRESRLALWMAGRHRDGRRATARRGLGALRTAEAQQRLTDRRLALFPILRVVACPPAAGALCPWPCGGQHILQYAWNVRRPAPSLCAGHCVSRRTTTRSIRRTSACATTAQRFSVPRPFDGSWTSTRSAPPTLALQSARERFAARLPTFSSSRTSPACSQWHAVPRTPHLARVQP